MSDKTDNNEMSKPATAALAAEGVDRKKDEKIMSQAEDVVEDKVSIQKILEGMTNEFNKSITMSKSVGAANIENAAPAEIKNNKIAETVVNVEKELKGKELNEKLIIKHSNKVVIDNKDGEKDKKKVSQITSAEESLNNINNINNKTKTIELITKAENCLSEESSAADNNIKESSSSSDQIVYNNSKKSLTTKKEAMNSTNSKETIPARIVLTFRTIDENTNDGKKTKISSCSSNLKLVPDELTNCDQIGGVSVKIENSDDNSNNDDNEDDSEDKMMKNFNSKERLNDKKNSSEDVKIDEVDNVKEVNDSDNKIVQANNKKAKTGNENNKNSTEAKEVNSVPMKRRVGRPRLRALSDSTEESPGPAGPKRSARRLCKESFKSTVLESAMARKEKSNDTGERKFKNERKYSRPGRPKKIVKWKDQNKNQSDVKNNSEIKNADHSINNSDLNGTQGDNNATLETSRNTNSSDKSHTELSSDDNNKKNSSTDFEGMPKLSPIPKTHDNNQTNSSRTVPPSPSTNEEDVVNNVETDKPFLKPIIARSKRERGRPKGSGSARKIAKADSFNEDGSPSVAETGKNNDYPEEGAVPAKRTRRSMVPSPSPAEGQASKPESTAILSEMCTPALLCLCQVRSQLYVTITGSGAPLYCTATDSIDNKLVGCCNEVDTNDVAMRRPSTRVPFIILCRMHKERLLRHNCCPSCGLFCTQGRFAQCINGHQYHRECEIYPNKKALCPHCGCESSSYDVAITMKAMRKPVFIPTRRKFSKLPSAKMGFTGKGDNTKLAGRPPSPLIPPEAIKILQPNCNTDRPERYTIMSLYTSVKNGDLEKLVNVLACGYNANHTFREYAHRTSLHIAADKGHLPCVHTLIQAGAQLDVMDKNQLTPLMLAATTGKVDVVKYLIKIGADVTLKGEDGMTVLHMAAKSGHLDVCQIILSECKVPRTLVDCVDDGGWTSLIWACEFCHTEVARFLLEKKCDPLIRDAEQNIALHWSAFSGSSEITELLLNQGCDVNAVNVHGDTPLHIAARQDQYAVSVLLLARGAKVGETNTAGETAVNCCPAEGDTMAALRLNAKVNELTEHMWESTVKILSNDISRGKETNPVQCVNGYDSEDKPTDFLYVTENCFTSSINVDRTITSLQSCRCEDNCNSEKCLCGNISLRCWYDDEGKLIPEFNYADPPMLFECNQACDCNRITCNNRVVQHGLTQRFQLFRTKGKGWGLRTLRFILKGTYVCEYVGEIISDSEADHREDDSYLFDLDNRDGETYCIDARRYGNLARFINHSCSPNLLPVRVFVEHQDLHFPRIAFFANRDIDADEELGFDYGEKFWIIKCKSFTCTCGSEACRYSETTIQLTLDNYRRKIQQEEQQLAAQVS